MKKLLATLTVAILAVGSAQATITTAMSQGYTLGELAAAAAADDLIAGNLGTPLAGDLGWHPANTNPNDQWIAFTDGTVPAAGAAGLNGLLNDFPPAGAPAKRVQYDLAGPSRIDQINFFSGNDGGDGRIFHTYTIELSQDGSTWGAPIYVQSHPSGTLNNAGNNGYTRVLTELFDDAGPLGVDVTNVRFDLYGVDNTGGQMRDPFDGVNPFTTTDDLLGAPNTSPLVFEIDVIGVPEPSTFALIGLGALGLVRRLRRR